MEFNVVTSEILTQQPNDDRVTLQQMLGMLPPDFLNSLKRRPGYLDVSERKMPFDCETQCVSGCP
jgi:hypothetical protein